MTLRSISGLLPVPNTAEENIMCEVHHMRGIGEVWKGPAKELHTCPYQEFTIVEIRRVIPEDTNKSEIPLYNCPYFITVV